MKKFDGEERLRRDTCGPWNPTVERLADNVYAFLCFGSSNALLIEGDSQCILVDAFENDYYSAEAKKEIERITGKTVKTIIYTHLHSDHIGGAAVFKDTVETVIAHAPHGEVLGRMNMIAKESGNRAVRQFGMKLTIEENMSMGLNPALPAKGTVNPIAPNMIIADEEKEIIIDGVTIKLVAAPGETDEGQYVVLPDSGIVCSSDNYYACWPNLSALRGSQYRDIDQWVASLEKLLAIEPKILMPGHSGVLYGKETIQEIISNYKNAINYVLDETLKGIAEGKTPDELVGEIHLPEELAGLRYLQEYYGTVAWSIRGIYAGYIGWFDGNPTNINPLPVDKKAEMQLKLYGGSDVVCAEIAKAILAENENDAQWAMELCDTLLMANTNVEFARKNKAIACRFLGRMQTSANGRHYYLTCAKELEQQN